MSCFANHILSLASLSSSYFLTEATTARKIGVSSFPCSSCITGHACGAKTEWVKVRETENIVCYNNNNNNNNNNKILCILSYICGCPSALYIYIIQSSLPLSPISPSLSYLYLSLLISPDLSLSLSLIKFELQR